MRKSILSAAALTLAASAALAGGPTEPVMEMAPVEIIEDTRTGGTSGNLIVPIILIALIAAAVSSSD